MIAADPTTATPSPDLPSSRAGSMNFASTSPPTPSPTSARSPRSRATAATTSTNNPARIPIGRSRSTLKKENVEGCPLRAGVCNSSIVSPRRSPESVTWGETMTSTVRPLLGPEPTRTRTWPQVGL